MYLKHKLYNLYIIDIKPLKYKIDNKCKKTLKIKSVIYILNTVSIFIKNFSSIHFYPNYTIHTNCIIHIIYPKNKINYVLNMKCIN